MSASLPMPEESGPSPADTFKTPRVSLNTAPRRETLATVLPATASLVKRSAGRAEGGGARRPPPPPLPRIAQQAVFFNGGGGKGEGAKQRVQVDVEHARH